MAEPNLPKRLKTDENEKQYFSNFLYNDNNMYLLKFLRRFMEIFRIGGNKLKLPFLRVTSANATSKESFKNARVDVEMMKDSDGYTSMRVAPISMFFLKGYVILAAFLDINDPRIPEDVAERRALRDLLQFLSDNHTCLAELSRRADSEWKWALGFAQHLLIPLVPHKRFLMDSCPGLNLKLCCAFEHTLSGEVGDTSYGCTGGWSGCVDVMLMGKEVHVPLSVLLEEENSDGISVTSDSTVEVKRDATFSSSGKQQVMAQTIVFSFLNHKQNIDKCDNFLVPGIGLSAKKLVFYMYDCVKDVLLGSLPFDIFEEGSLHVLNVQTVIVLWLLLNYKVLGSGVPDAYNEYRSGFHQQIGEQFLEMYMTKVESPCHVESSEQAEEADLISAFCYEDPAEYMPDLKYIKLKT